MRRGRRAPPALPFAGRHPVPEVSPLPGRTRILLLVAALAVGAAVPAAGTTNTSELDATRGQLSGVQRQLSEIEREVQVAADTVAALDERLRNAATELTRVRAQLERAEEALAAARAVERETALEVAAADVELEGLVDDWDAQRRQLEQRAIHAFKYGTGAPRELLVRGIAGATDWHEVAVTLETVGRLVADDRALVDDTATLTRDTATLRAEVGDVRRTAVDAARTAAREQRRVEDLLRRQETIVATIDAERAERAAVLARLEADAEAKAVLVSDLRRRVAQLELAAVAALVPVDLGLDVDGPPPEWAHRLPPAGQAYAPAIEAVAARHGLDGRLLAALVWTESSFRPDAVSHAGALGLAQLMPGTARGLRVDPRDPLQNLDGGARYLRSQLARFGQVDLALAAYNAGPNAVAAAGGVPDITETQLYVVRVLERYSRLAGHR